MTKLDLSIHPVGGRNMAHGLDCSVEPSMTQQSFKDECDINKILAGYDKGQVNDFARDVSSGVYADLTSFGDYHDSMNKVIAAQEAFDELPAHIRSFFENDPAKFLEFVSDPSNGEKVIELGLGTKREAHGEFAAQSATPHAASAKDAIAELQAQINALKAGGSPKDLSQP